MKAIKTIEQAAKHYYKVFFVKGLDAGFGSFEDACGFAGAMGRCAADVDYVNSY